MIVGAVEARALIAAHWLRDAEQSSELGSITLHAHQRSAIGRLNALLREHHGALLADEAGLGKTYVAAAMMREAGRPLLVLPAALRSMWRASLHASGVRATMVTYSALSRGTVPDGDFDLIVLDEAHHARTSSTLRYAVLASLTARSRVLLITATPVHNRRAELAALFALFLGARAYSLTDAESARLIVRRAREDVAAAVPLPDAPAPVRIEVRDDAALLDAVLALPPPVPPADGGVGGVLLVWSLLRQWASSRGALAGALKRRIARGIALESALEEGRYPDRRELRAWSCADDAIQLAFPQLVAGPTSEPHALLALVRAHLDAVRALLNRVREGVEVDESRARALREICTRHRGEKVLAFSQYADTVHAMYELLRDKGAVAALTSRGARIAGGRLSRQEALSRFAPRAMASPAPAAADRIDILLTTDLASEGLNLHDASVVVHLDLPWTPARLEQRVARSRRLGALHARTWSYALAPPASTERVLAVERRLRQKLRTMEEVIGTTGALLPVINASGEPSGESAHRAEASGAQTREQIQRALTAWRNAHTLVAPTPATADAPAIAIVSAPRRAILALALDGVQPTLAAAFDDPDLSEDPVLVLAAIELVAGDDAVPDDRVRAAALQCAERWLARRAGAQSGGALAWRGASRRSALRRIAGLASRAPHHRRALIAPLAIVARRVVSAPYALGAERVLDELASASLPDEAWLRALASFGAMHGAGEHQHGAATLVAIIVAGQQLSVPSTETNVLHSRTVQQPRRRDAIEPYTGV
ncbi:MAG: DEAD/DEAH box helicase [Gemmatimonadaceae bacterium]|nr:DEAD/DEAH box helicase [Gemmatimonadaceae bacterium]